MTSQQTDKPTVSHSIKLGRITGFARVRSAPGAQRAGTAPLSSAVLPRY
jgi:hypothetical protein